MLGFGSDRMREEGQDVEQGLTSGFTLFTFEGNGSRTSDQAICSDDRWQLKSVKGIVKDTGIVVQDGFF